MLNSHNNIIIFSRPIRTGKTTELFQYIKNTKKVGGFLTPDVDRKRMLYDIALDKYNPFETDIIDKETTIQIGKFSFLQSTFEIGKEIITRSNKQNTFIIDEVGKLEIEMNIGFEPAVKNIIDQYKTKNFQGNLLVVIRDTLLERAINKYRLDGVKVIGHL